MQQNRFNPFQGCRWVLCYLVLCGHLYILLFQSLSGLSLGSLILDRSLFKGFLLNVSIPFRAVAGFFGSEWIRQAIVNQVFQSLSGLSLGSLPNVSFAVNSS